MNSNHSSARSSVSQNSISSDVVVESSIPSGIVLNAFTKEIIAYEKKSDETHAVKIKGNVYDSVDDCVVVYMKYVAEAGFVRKFGDVVSSDATFKRNKYNMVFVPFTVIDNHRKYVTVVAGLLKNETTKSYIWLLKEFIKAFGKAPSIVVTDQDGAMRNAIEAEFAGSKHRLCIWGKLMEEFKLENHKWLTKMFNIRSTWIPAYFIDSSLCGLMRTTSRSESENSFFSHFTNSGSTLMNFMNYFEMAMEKKRHVQEMLDHKTIDIVPKLKTFLKIEWNASNVYTRSLFELVQKEIFVGLWHCQIVSKSLVEGSEVLQNIGDGSVVCSCQFFVRVGILCKHIFCVFKNANVEMIPQQYILRRWMKNLIPAALRNKRNIYGEKNLKSLKKDVEADCPNHPSKNKTDNLEQLVGVPKPPVVKVNNPTVGSTKGRKKLRIKGGKEKAIEKSLKGRNSCSLCGGTDHNKRTCPGERKLKKDRIGSKRDKNEKRGKAEKSQVQLQSIKKDNGSFVDKIIFRAPDSPDQFHCFHCKDVLRAGEACKRCTYAKCGSGLGKGLCYICGHNQNSLNDSPSIFETSSQSPPNINHCYYECGDPLDGILCKRCTCKFYGKDAHIDYNCPSKILVISNSKPYNNKTIDELSQTLPIFHPTFHSEAESPFTLDSTPTYVDESPNVFNPPPQSLVYPCEFCGNDAYYGHYCTPQAPFIYLEPCYNQDFNFSTLAKIKDQMTSITSLCEMACQVVQKKLEEKQIEEERTAKAKYWKLPVCYDADDDEERSDSLNDNIISGLPLFSAITPDEPVLFTEEPDNSLSMGDEHLDTISATESDEFIKSGVENLIPIPSESEGIPEHMCDVPSHDNSPPLDISKDQFKDLSESNEEFSSTEDDSFSFDKIDYVEASPPNSELVSSEVMEIVIPEVGEIKASNDNPILFYDPIISGTPPNLTPSRESGFFLEVDAFLAVEDEFPSSQFPKSYLNPEGDMLLFKAFLNDDHSSDFKTKSSFTSLNSLLEETNNFNNSLPEFTTFSKVLFDAKYESDSSDDQSCSDEDVLEKIVSKPLSEEEIIPMESLCTHDSSLPISSKIDSLLDEFAGELTLLKSISPRIDETDCDFEEDICLIEKLLYDNSSPRPLEEFVSTNSDAAIKSFSPSPILVTDSDSLMEEIDLFCTPDYPMPSGIVDKDYDSERDILIPKDLPSNNTLSFAEKESLHFDILPSCPNEAKARTIELKLGISSEEEKGKNL
nr:protein FAR1-related sequence 5-like [Tanacetum cinerariifolium]